MVKWLLCLLVLFVHIHVEAGYTIRDGHLVNTADVPKYSAVKHYDLAVKALNSKDYHEAAYHFNIIAKNFPNEPFYADAHYYLGVCYFYDAEYDFANEAFNSYLQCQSNPPYFEDAIGYKLMIANSFKEGAKKRFFGTKLLPKWAPAGNSTVEIYNEVITSLPCHDYAAQALWGKAYYHWNNFEFKESVEAFQMLIRRFPKHELTPCAYLCINRVYYAQAQCEFQNPDLLALAQINAKRFEKAFPKDERLQEAQADVQAIKELYAKGLFETGQFYERIQHPEASVLYYRKAIQEFPDTSYANCSRNRLFYLGAEGELCVEPSS